MKILVTGSKGLLGKEFSLAFISPIHEVIGVDIDDFDITDPSALKDALTDIAPDCVINCAAYTKVDACEDHQSLAFKLNAEAPGEMAMLCKELKIKLCHISTDYVFDGTKEVPYTEKDKPNPINVYGQSKLQGELAIQRNMDDFIIVRTQWIFGFGGPNFVKTILDLAKDKKEIKVVNDQFGRPTYTRNLSLAIALLIEMDASGIFHVCNTGSASWYDLAKKAVEYAGFSTKVLPVPTEEFPRPAKRPMRSVLSTEKFSAFAGKNLETWQVALKEYVDGLKGKKCI
jgi:dTDP-4-dehydrorhamnose reductase